MSKAVVLLSGGMDSVTAMAMAAQKYEYLYPLFVDYSQRHISEYTCAVTQSLYFAKCTPRVAFAPIWRQMDIDTCSSLTSLDREYPITKGNSETLPNSFVPMRNMIFMSYAFSLAYCLNAEDIVLGTNTTDYSGYPDCRVEALAAVARAANRCLGNDLKETDSDIGLFIPLETLTKAQIIREGTKLGVDYSQTVTCYDADEEGRACGECPSCRIRKHGFKQAGLTDVTRYRGEKSNDNKREQNETNHNNAPKSKCAKTDGNSVTS